MNIALDHWHIEVSSICTLKCPRCTRTEVPKTMEVIRKTTGGKALLLVQMNMMRYIGV